MSQKICFHENNGKPLNSHDATRPPRKYLGLPAWLHIEPMTGGTVRYGAVRGNVSAYSTCYVCHVSCVMCRTASMDGLLSTNNAYCLIARVL